MVDGKRLREWDFVWGPYFTPDGKVVYAANQGGDFSDSPFGIRLAPPRGGKWVIVVEEQVRDLAAGMETLSRGLRVAPDGSIVYAARKSDRECVVRGDQPGPLFASVDRLGFGPDGRSLLYVAKLSEDRRKRNYHLVIDGKVNEEAFWYIESWAVSPDGKTVALKTHEATGIQVAVGRQRSEVFDLVYDFNFSPDGKKLAFCARRGQKVWWKVMELK